MSSWISRTASNHAVHLTATAIVSGCVVGFAILGLQRARRTYVVEDVKASIPDISPEHQTIEINEYGAATANQFAPSKEDERGMQMAARARKGEWDDALIMEQLARNRVFLTDEGLKKLRSSFIIVVGLGGVGSHCTAALARSGASKIRLIDFDQVTLSSLNRHAVATLADVGTPKVHCMQRRLEQIAPWVQFDCRNELFGEGTAKRQLEDWDGQKPDFVVDAIDNIDSKVALLNYCFKNNLKVISSMGAGCKSDPTRILIGDISASTDDPLSKSTRRRLRAMGVKDGINVVFSTERPGPGKAQLQPLAEEEFSKGKVNELGVLPDFRVRILPVLGTMPAIFGLCVANHLMLEIADYPHEYVSGKIRESMYDGIMGALQGLEARLAKHQGTDPIGLRIPVTQDDVGYLVDEVYSGRSVVSGLTTRLALTRWHPPPANFVNTSVEGQKYSPLKLKDLVLMTKEEATRHAKEVLQGTKTAEEVWGAEIVANVEAKLDEEAIFERFRS